jgi:hypothetical protein
MARNVINPPGSSGPVTSSVDKDLHGFGEENDTQHGLGMLFTLVIDMGAVVHAQYLKEHASHDGAGCASVLAPRRSFREILEDETITKVFWGARGKAGVLERLLDVHIDKSSTRSRPW